MIKIGICPYNLGTTAIALFENDKLIDSSEITSNNWLDHYKFIINFLNKNFISMPLIENCLISPTSDKNRDDLLRLLGALETTSYNPIYISPKYTKNIVNNMENYSKYNNACIWGFEPNLFLNYQYQKGWKYDDKRISNQLRNAIIIAYYKK